MPHGLPNFGNTCYLNAALQNIFHIFGDTFISGHYFRKVKQDNAIRTFTNNFAHLTAAVENKNNKWNKKHVEFYLKNVIKFLSQKENFKRFINFQQADSNDFLNELLDLLSEMLTYDVFVQINVKVPEETLSQEDKDRLLFFRHIQNSMKETSVIKDALQGFFKASITCGHEDCDNSSVKFESFLTLSLPINNMKTLEQCLLKYIKPIKLDKDNQWFCDKCKRKSQATKKMSIWNTSHYLIISYKRYMSNLVKDNNEVVSPMELDMTPFLESGESKKYRLCSMTVHSGGLSSGHYVSVRKIGQDWVLFDDDSIKKVKQLNPNHSYYLVYKLC
jgi:ubiquitin C-terminal hydrolase